MIGFVGLQQEGACEDGKGESQVQGAINTGLRMIVFKQRDLWRSCAGDLYYSLQENDGAISELCDSASKVTFLNQIYNVP